MAEWRTADKATLCWTCRNATNPPPHVCSWSRELVPVEGWTATGRVYEAWHYKGRTTLDTTYCVHACPLYESDAANPWEREKKPVATVDCETCYTRKICERGGYICSAKAREGGK